MRLRTMLVVTVVLLAVVGLGVYVAFNQATAPQPPSAVFRACQVQTQSGGVTLNFDQMANAATIAAVGLTRKVPDRGIIVALATSLQESKLENLSGGDRDSIGLFQQRPSQGWGKAEQIQDPRYAATKFYNALLKIKNWQSLRITEAAQRVQRSAYPDAYDEWTDEAGVLAEALTGSAEGAVSCTSAVTPERRGDDATQSLGHGLRLDWGTVTTLTPPGLRGMAIAAGSVRAGWQYAHWIVAHSVGNGVQRVRYSDREWTADSGEWRDIAPSLDVSAGSGAGNVVAEVYS